MPTYRGYSSIETGRVERYPALPILVACIMFFIKSMLVWCYTESCAGIRENTAFHNDGLVCLP